jgi:hypothetical protein
VGKSARAARDDAEDDLGGADPESHAFHRQLAESLAVRERERAEARERERQADLRENPPDPRAASIVGAVLADEIVLTSVEHRLRPIAGEEDSYATEALLTVADVGVLALVLHLLGECRPVVIEDWGYAARFRRRDPLIPSPENLRPALRELHRIGLVRVQVEGGTALVDYGPEARQIARPWGPQIGGE